MGPAILLLFALLFAQDSHSIPKTHKRTYTGAAENCRKAEKLVQPDPAEAVRLLTTIIDNKKIVKRECRLRIEMRSGTYSKWYDFHPYQFRGLAYLELAGKAPNRNARINLLEKAETDFAESVSRNLPSSKPELDKVRETLLALQKEIIAEEKEPPFRKDWEALTDDGRFTAARKHVEEKGGFLSAEKKKQYLSDTEKKCLEALRTATLSFYRALRDHPESAALSGMDASRFQSRFRLPSRSDLVKTSYGYTWCRSVLNTLDRLRRGGDVLQALLTHGIEAIPLKAPLVFLEPLAWSIARNQVETLTKKSRDAPARERETLRRKADGVQETWNQFTKKVQDSAMRGKLPVRNFAPLFNRFPVEWKGAPALETSIETALESKNPVEALASLEKDLSNMKKEWDHLAIESRRDIVGHQITVGALRRLAALESVETTAEELEPFGKEWKSLGGSVPPDRFGPRVKEVFREMLR